jgi:SAM-dependent methyltransferase
MSDLFRHDPTGRFTGLSDLYARHRPDYPPAVIDALVECCGLDGSTIVVDVGSGTGISARQVAARGIPVVGIEPNDEMRTQAVNAPLPEGAVSLEYRAGTAEATSLEDATASLVLSAQAFHWFDPERALAEFHRILKPGGWVGLLWNERDESDPFTRAYGEVIRSAPDAKKYEHARATAGLPLLSHPLFHDGRQLVFHHEQVLDEDGLLGRAFSASYVPREPPHAERFMERLREVFARFEHAGRVTLRYETTLYLARA